MRRLSLMLLTLAACSGPGGGAGVGAGSGSGAAPAVVRTCRSAQDCPPPVVDRAGLDHDVVPGCRAGSCVTLDVPRPTACASDADCVLSCRTRGECCSHPCRACETPWHAADLAAADSWAREHCGEAQCTRAKCLRPPPRALARCQAGRCVAAPLP